ncbi:MAG TPA: DUF6249 domain-containing protein [Dysgonamonadaceae bacterium]|nr:DUF6249 domain-containing protein [Dysgonamonadaceae bacterium]
METLVAVISILSIFALPIITALVLIFKKISSTHKERMGLIEQGIIPPNEPKRKRTPNRYVSLRNGIVLIALGIGVIVGFLGTNYLVIGENNPFLFLVASVILFLGVGYTVFFLITKDTTDYKNVNLDSDLEDDAE